MKAQDTWEIIGALFDAHSIVDKQIDEYEKMKRDRIFTEYGLVSQDRDDDEIASLVAEGHVITVCAGELAVEFDKQWQSYKSWSVEDQKKILSEIVANSFNECVRKQVMAKEATQKSAVSTELAQGH